MSRHENKWRPTKEKIRKKDKKRVENESCADSEFTVKVESYKKRAREE